MQLRRLRALEPRRIRLLVLLVGVLAAALMLGGWTQRWFDIVLVDGTRLPVSGQIAAPALSGIALATLALVGALTIARRRLRVVLGVVQLALGALAVVVVSGALASAIDSASPTITDATGVAGSDSVALLVASLVVDAWPWLSLQGAVLAVLAGLAVIVTSNSWPKPTAKYDGETQKADSTAGAWDALSEGDDPTSR